MSEALRLNKVLKELNISMQRAVDFLDGKSISIEPRPTTKIPLEVYNILVAEFQQDAKQKAASEEVVLSKFPEKPASEIKVDEKPMAKDKIKSVETPKDPPALPKTEPTTPLVEDHQSQTVEVVPDILETPKVEIPEPSDIPVEQPTPIEQALPEPIEKPAAILDDPDAVLKAKSPTLKGLKPLGKMELPVKTKKSSVKAAAVDIEKSEPKPIPEELPKEEPVIAQEQPIESDVILDEPQVLETQYQKLEGPRITGQTIDLSKFDKVKKPKVETLSDEDIKKKKRRRIVKDETVKGGATSTNTAKPNAGPKKTISKRNDVDYKEPSEQDVQKQIKETLEKLTNKKGGTNKGAKHRRDKRIRRQEDEAEQMERDALNKTLEVTEFVTVQELASLMDVSVTEVISACMSLGIMVTMNQRLEADIMQLVADEFGFEIKFIGLESDDTEEEEQEEESSLQFRSPIVTVMGHVDHGKTSLLDYIRKTNVIAGESGGITQHIGAYNVELKNGEHITFLDTPGHEAFTAMRARGAKVTDIAIIVIAADDQIMPQTREAISHAQAAGVPMIFAINKVDKPGANPEKVKEQLSQMNLLVEDWGGNLQSQEVSAKTGLNIDELLEKVLLEAEVLELKSNPDRSASGTVIEATLDKGRGYVSTIIVQNGTLQVGDYVLAGRNHGKVRAMLDERGQPIKKAGPSTPVTILGLDGAPTAGDIFKVYEDEREAKQLATKRQQLQREQSIRTQKHITLDEIGRRIALGEFKELNIILKGDVDGSVEALSDSLQKLSTQEIHVNILHKGVGQITESDVLLAAASDAIIIGFNVRPGTQARTLADNEEVEIRTYSIIYDAINELKEAMEGMLSPETKEEVIGNVEIREVFKISKIGTIAGCMVLDGKIIRNANIRLIREGIVVHTGNIESLKRFKDDAKEVTKGYECGLNLKGYNDIQVGDIIEVFQEVEVKKKL